MIYDELYARKFFLAFLWGEISLIFIYLYFIGTCGLDQFDI